VGKPQRKRTLAQPRRSWRIILKEFLRNGVGIWNGLNWHGIDIDVGLLGMR
jgi:hypothetical protein